MSVLAAADLNAGQPGSISYLVVVVTFKGRFDPVAVLLRLSGFNKTLY